MIIAFVLDTSASMNQRASHGLSLLDIAKGAIELFLKLRGRDQQAIRTDRFLLVTFEDGPGAVRCGWKDAFSTFMQELKNATAKDLTQVGPALKRSFDLLNQFRLQTSIDNYGQGRIPWFLEPTAIILLTDGGSFSSPAGITDNVMSMDKFFFFPSLAFLFLSSLSHSFSLSHTRSSLCLHLKLLVLNSHRSLSGGTNDYSLSVCANDGFT